MFDSVEAETNPDEPSFWMSHRGIFAGAATLGGGTILVKLIALAKDWLVARQIGASDELDAFLLAFLIPSFAIVVLAHSFASALVPTYVRVSHQQGPEAARRLVSGTLVGGCGILVATTLLLSVAAPYLFPWIGWGFGGAKLALTESLFYPLAAILVVGGISAIFAAVLNAEEHFAVAALAPIAMPLCTLVVFWLLEDRYGIQALAAGTLLGFVVECAALGLAMRRYGLLDWPRLRGLDENLRHVSSQCWPLAVGALLMSSSTVVDQSMAASLGSGNVSILNYGNKIVALVLTIVAVSLSTVLFPRFSRMVAAGHWDALKRSLGVYSRLVLIVSVPGVALLVVISEPLVRLLFQRGAFTQETTAQVSQVQIYLAMQIPFYVLNMVGIRLLSALDANRTVLRIGTVNLVLNVGGNLVFMHWFGVSGIAMSTSLVYLAASLMTFTAIRFKLNEMASRRS